MAEHQPIESTGEGLSRRDFLHTCAVAGATAAGLLPQGGCALAARKPNLVLIMADDLGYECLGCNGGTSYRTPTLDSLAATGVRFTDCYATPLCTPSRVQVMSGQYPFRNGWTSAIWERPTRLQVVDPELIILGRVLKRAGYATAVVGKWQLAMFAYHPDHPSQAGFDEHCLWTWNWHDLGARARLPRYWEPGIWQNGAVNELANRKDVFGPDVFTDFLIEFIRRHKSGPFFAYYPMVLPHPPFVPTPDDRKRGNSEGSFAGMVSYVDTLVARIVNELDELGIREQTLVLFTSDNGSPREVVSRMGDVILRGGKGEMRGTGAHVPLVASWIGTAPAGRVCGDLVDFTDILPTLADAAGAEIPAGHTVDGRSFLPQLRGKTGTPREWVLIQMDGSLAVRTKRWKLFNTGRLYDLSVDPFQENPIRPEDENEQTRAARRKLEGILADLKSPLEM